LGVVRTSARCCHRLNEGDRLSLGRRVLLICQNPWPDWVTKEWVDESDQGRLGERLIVYHDESWMLVYEVPQPLVVVIYSFDHLD
jgi:hypothetical protein